MRKTNEVQSCDESIVLQCGMMQFSIEFSVELDLRSKISFEKGDIMIFKTVYWNTRSVLGFL